MSEHNSFFINCLAFCCLDALEFIFNSHEVSTGRDLNYFCVLIQQCCSRHLGAHIFAHYSKLLFVAQSCPTLATPWSVVCQAPLSIGFSRQEYWSGLPFPSPGDLSNPGVELESLAWQVDFLPLHHLESPNSKLSIGSTSRTGMDGPRI